MSAKRQIFKLSALKKLLNEENSCVSLMSCTRRLAIVPYYLNDMKAGVLFSLNKFLKKYDTILRGIVIGYQKVKILWNEDSGKIPMGSCSPELDVRVEFYVFRPRIGNIIEGIINKKSNNHIGCLVHRCFNATILRPEDVTFEDWICKDFNINDKVIFKVKDLDFTGSVPYIEGDIDESLFNQCKPNLKNCDLQSTIMASEEIEAEVNQNPNIDSENVSSPIKHEEIEARVSQNSNIHSDSENVSSPKKKRKIETKVSQNPNIDSENVSSPVKHEEIEAKVSQNSSIGSENVSSPKKKTEIEAEVNQNPNIDSENVSSPIKHEDLEKDKKKKNVNKKKCLSQINQSIALNSLKSALYIDLNSQINKTSYKKLKTNKSIKDNDTTSISEELTNIKTKKHKKNQDEGDKGEEDEETKVKKKKNKKSKKKDKEGDQIQIEDLNTLTEEKCVDGLHDDGVKKEGFDAESSKSKKKKKKKKEEPSSQSESSKKTMEVTLVNEDNDSVFYSTQLDPSKKSEKLNITFCSPIPPEPISGNKKRKKEKDKRQQVLESSLTLVNKEEKESSTKDKKSKSLKRKRERESESEGLSTPKKYKNGNMYDVMYSPSPKKSYVDDKSLFSDSEKSFKVSPFKKGIKLNGNIHNVFENCDTEKDVHKPTVQSLLDEIRKEVSERFQSESKQQQQNRESCQDGEKNKESKTVEVEIKEEEATKKKKKKKKKEKEKEKNKIEESKETCLTENTATSLYEKLLQEAMNSINLTNDEASSASSASKPFEGKNSDGRKERRNQSRT